MLDLYALIVHFEQFPISFMYDVLVFYFQFKPQEITDILKDFEEPGHLAPTGLHIAGTKYMVIQGEAGAVIRGKKVITLHT